MGGPTLASLQSGTYSSQNSFGDEDFDSETLEAEDRVGCFSSMKLVSMKAAPM